MGPTIRNASLVDYPEIARTVGLNPDKMLERLDCLRNADLRISAGAVAELLEASASAARVDDLALRLAQRCGLSNLRPLALIVREQLVPDKDDRRMARAHRKLVEENGGVIVPSNDLAEENMTTESAVHDGSVYRRLGRDAKVGPIIRKLRSCEV